MNEDLGHGVTGNRRLITVFGGTGFLGRRVVRCLLNHGFQVRAASRHPDPVGSGVGPGVGPEPTTADIHDETSVAAALSGVLSGLAPS
jgi:uncharacterized protein YbjT (DUF2867 family)